MNDTSIQKYKVGQKFYHISRHDEKIITEGKILSIDGNVISIRWINSVYIYSHDIGEPLFKHVITCCSECEG